MQICHCARDVGNNYWIPLAQLAIRDVTRPLFLAYWGLKHKTNYLGTGHTKSLRLAKVCVDREWNCEGRNWYHSIFSRREDRSGFQCSERCNNYWIPLAQLAIRDVTRPLFLAYWGLKHKTNYLGTGHTKSLRLAKVCVDREWNCEGRNWYHSIFSRREDRSRFQCSERCCREKNGVCWNRKWWDRWNDAQS